MFPCPRLIEVVMPIREVSAESVRDKSIRHGHLSTLHLWWARRPLPVCRAVVFASLVPDPDDEACPPVFREAVQTLLVQTYYDPYADIPYTTAYDPMDNTPRNRLLMFMGKYSDEFIAATQAGKTAPAGKLLSEYSLVKWETRRNETTLDLARKLIFVSHHADEGHDLPTLLDEYEALYHRVREAEKALYLYPNRHLSSPEVDAKAVALQVAIEAYLDRMPRVFDPFAGGGAIPLEAARLGCRTFGNDINPVAHVIQRASLEFPQRFGKKLILDEAEFTRLYGANTLAKKKEEGTLQQMGQQVEIPNRLSFDVAFYAKKLLALTEAEVGHLYPKNGTRTGANDRPIAYYWARTAICANPSCRAEVPLLKGFYLCDKPDKQVYLEPLIRGNTIDFDLKIGKTRETGWMNKSALQCPCCGNTTPAEEIRRQLAPDVCQTRLLAVIDERTVKQIRPLKGKLVTVESTEKFYRLPTAAELAAVENSVREFDELDRPAELLPNVTRLTGGFIVAWGYSTWGQMFSPRQLLTLNSLVRQLNTLKEELYQTFSEEYVTALCTLLAVWIDRMSAVNTTFGRWDVSRENIQSPFARQAIPMVFDYPESVPFTAGSGSPMNQLDWICRYIEDESENFVSVECRNASSGDVSQFLEKYLDAAVTDPPYYDAIAYADLSDFFYVWLKRTLSDVYPFNFAFPQTPKTEECTALKHHHGGNADRAKRHFETKLAQIFAAIERQTRGVVSVMFAHQSTEAWTTLCNSLLAARLNITGSWAIDTEMENRSVGLAGAALGSSVTVSCRPVAKTSIGEFKTVEREIRTRVGEEVELLYHLGFRGSDLLTACFGQAVGVFGHYETVQKLSGEEVTVAELLALAREAAFNALVRNFSADDGTRFYLAWLQLNGFTESDFDEVNKLIRAGLGVETKLLFDAHLLIRRGNRQALATRAQRMAENIHLGERVDGLLLDRAHRAMHLWVAQNRPSLVAYLRDHLPTAEDPVWRVLTALAELLRGSDEGKPAEELLANKENLLREVKQKAEPVDVQYKMFM